MIVDSAMTSLRPLPPVPCLPVAHWSLSTGPQDPVTPKIGSSRALGAEQPLPLHKVNYFFSLYRNNGSWQTLTSYRPNVRKGILTGALPGRFWHAPYRHFSWPQAPC